ncbi:MAG: hypothetical protein V2A62_01565 [Candidatus Woesearchaeota archaeon]
MTHAKNNPKRKDARVEKDPNFMVQINEPRMLRKDILESVREVIIFMQGYEKFRKIQEEKVTLFTQLKTDVRVLNSLVEDKLRKYLPKGKLKAVQLNQQPAKPADFAYQRDEEPLSSSTLSSPVPSTGKVSSSELDELESQLKDIETQLRNVG